MLTPKELRARRELRQMQKKARESHQWHREMAEAQQRLDPSCVDQMQMMKNYYNRPYPFVL